MSKLNIHSKVKLNNGVQMPLFGLGMYLSPPGEQAKDSALYAIKKANYIHLDSAEYYKNEKDAGDAVRESGVPREKIFVTTKIFTTAGGKQHAIEVIENSLKQMNIGYIDQILLHAPMGGHVLEAYDVLLDYQKRGLIKTVGVSNFGVTHLEALKHSGRPLPQVNQIELHPWCQQRDILDWCHKNGVVIVGYSPLAKAQKLADPLVVELSKKYNKTPAQILIRWSLQKEAVTIPKSNKPQRIDENANVFDFELSAEDMQRLDDAGKNVKEVTGWDPTTNDLAEHFGPTK
jgi:diketogulonate reductase-like aldo/keto reductase